MAAIIGAGPAGLACAERLASAGASAVVFDRAKEAGGVVANVVPSFRIRSEDLGADPLTHGKPLPGRPAHDLAADILYKLGPVSAR